MKRINIVIFIALLFPAFLAFSGCATQKDLETIQRDTNNNTKELLALQRNLYDLHNEKKSLSGEIKNLSSKMDALGIKIDVQQQEITSLGAETRSKLGFLEAETRSKIASLEKEIDTSAQPMRRYQADLGARLDKLQMEVQNLMGRFEESKYFAQRTFGETKTIREAYQGKLDELDKRIAALNKSVEDWDKKFLALQQEKESKAAEGEEEAEAEAEKPSTVPGAQAKADPTKVEPAKVATPAKKAEPEEKKPVVSLEEAYKKAYDQFTKGDIEGAKKGFQKFLEVYPKSKFAENAHYWLGECYFAEKKFEEAILEFDEVIKKYPKGNKVPDALYRQGIAFLEMADTVNAKLILKEVIKRYPKSDQANRARKKLKDIG